MSGSLYRMALLVAGTAPSPAPAQQAPPVAPAADVAPSSERQLQDIVVTAQRREEKIQNVPIAITAISASQLSAAGIASVQDLAVLTPSLESSNQLGNFQPRIRGIGSALFGPGIESSIATYVDGVYIAALPASLFSFAGVDRVEVLKGPQGTLFGRNATGGLIQVVTRQPSFTSSGSLALSRGNYQTFAGDIYLTGPVVSDKLAADVAVHGLTQGKGYGRNEFTGDATNRTDYDIALRSQLYFDSTSGTTGRFAVDYSTVAGSAPAFRPYPTKYGTELFGPNPRSNRPWDNDTNVPFQSETESYGVSGRITQELPFANLVSITAYRRSNQFISFDLDQTRNDALAVEFTERDRQFSQELQLTSAAGSRISWLLGGYYFSSRGRLDPEFIRFGPILVNPAFPLNTIRQTAVQTAKSYAAFGQATVPFGKVVNLTAGLRYTSERRGFSGDQVGFLTDGTSVGTLGSQALTKVTFDKLTWRLAADHRFSPGVMAYASYNRGFKSGGFNALGNFGDPPYRPETLDAYEVGVKADLFSRRLRINPAFFYYDYKQIQVPIYSSGLIQVVNGPTARIYGLDLDFIALVTRALTLRGGLSVIHDRYGDFPGAVRSTPLPGGGNLLTAFNAKGYRIPFTADWSGTIAADYKVPTSFGQVLFTVTYNHSDGYFTETDNIRRQTPYNLVSGSIQLSSAKDRYYLTLWAKNLTNEAVALVMNSSQNGGGAEYQPPRTFGGTIGLRY